MKTILSLIAGFLLLLSASDTRSEQAGINTTKASETIVSVTCAPELYSLASGWADEYNSLHPEVTVRVMKSNAYSNVRESEKIKGITLGFSATPEEDINTIPVVVGRSVLIPVINRQNPYREQLLQKGVSQALLAGTFSQPEKQLWSTLISAEATQPVHIYIVNDDAMKKRLAGFLAMTNLPESGITLSDKAGILKSIQNDPLALGFCNITDLTANGAMELAEDISLLPIDRNGNGQLEYFEDIYGDLNQLMRGIWIGKYPKDLYHNIYASFTTQAPDQAESEFLRWMVTAGQKTLNSSGYSDLVTPEIQTQLDRIDQTTVIVPTAGKNSTGIILLRILLGIIAATVVISLVIRRLFPGKATPEAKPVPVKVFDENAFNLPRGLLFDKNHTWAFMERDGKVKIGMDDFMRHITGPITRIVMKNTGEPIKKGEFLFSIVQSGKQLNLYAPVSGTIVERNEALKNKAIDINEAQSTDGWIYMIEPSNWLRDMQLLEMADRYETFLKSEFSRVKDFLAALLRPESPEYAHVVMQDGGQLMDGVLSEFGPEVWEDFQTVFLDRMKA